MDAARIIEPIENKTQNDADEIVGEKIKSLYRTLLQFSAENNFTSNEYILVTEKNILSALSMTSAKMKYLEQVTAAIVIIANPAKSEYWIQHSIFAGGNLWISAVALGLQAMWEGLYQENSKRLEQAFASQFDIPEQYRIMAIMGLWYPLVPISKPGSIQNGSGIVTT
jgi:nitroreductase